MLTDNKLPQDDTDVILPTTNTNKYQIGFTQQYSPAPRYRVDSAESVEIWNRILKSGPRAFPKPRCTKNDDWAWPSGLALEPKKAVATTLGNPPKDKQVSGSHHEGQERNLPDADLSSKLTKEALLEKTGAAPQDASIDDLEQAVSDSGLEKAESHLGLDNKNRSVYKTQAIDSRNFLAEAVNDLQDWNGGWMPAPEWEQDRPLCTDYMPDFIRNWARDIPEVHSKVNTTAQEFRTGRCSVSLTRFLEPPEYPDAFPDMLRSEDETKQLKQTAEYEAEKRIRKLAKKKRHATQLRAVAEHTLQEIAEQIPEVSPNAPRIQIYLRPARMEDVHGITTILNHYVLNSIVTEDHVEVSDDDVRSLLTDICEGSLPFIVAVQGKLPQSPHKETYERVLGFAYAEGFFGIRNTAGDSSRYTAVLRFYVHHQYTRKGIGRCLLDRLLEVTTRTHASNNAYDWINTNNDPVYNNHGGDGPRRYHQLLIERRVERKNDPDIHWMKPWLLYKFFFEQVGLFRSAARTSRYAFNARFLDVVYFQFEAASELEFDPIL